jgi:anti-sigma regulatory factor (Ser/Thr protein kinase)
MGDSDPELVERVVLLVSELATNAVVHARTVFGVDIDVRGNFVRVAVSDAGGGVPEVQPLPPPSAPHGRGLLVVSRLADRWGIETSAAGNGKSVWFEVDLRPPLPA